MFGTVDKLLPGSRYEIKVANSVVKVRGTEFFIDKNTCAVHVTDGSTVVRLVLQTQFGTMTKDITVSAGYSLYIPNQFLNQAAFDALSATRTPPGLSRRALFRLSQVGKMTRYTAGSLVTETFQAQVKRNGQIKVDKSSKVVVVSP